MRKKMIFLIQKREDTNVPGNSPSTMIKSTLKLGLQSTLEAKRLAEYQLSFGKEGSERQIVRLQPAQNQALVH